MRIFIKDVHENCEERRIFVADNVEGLVSSIKEHGVLQPIAIDSDNVIVDGHRRVKACRELGIETIDYQIVENTIENVLSLNQHRRKKYSELLREGLEWEKILSAKAKENQQRGGQGYPSEGQPFHTNVEVAKRLGIGKDSYFKLKKINEKQPELLEQIDSGEMSIKEAYSRVAPPKDTNTTTFPTPEDDPEETSEPQTEKEPDVEPDIEPDDGEEEEEEPEDEDDNKPLPTNTKDDGLPRLVLADPPWKYNYPSPGHGSPEDYYETLTPEHIIAHKPNTAKNCILYLWATAPKLREALEVMKGWGFDYITSGVWIKGGRTNGYWFRVDHELLLVGVKGRTNLKTPGEIHVPDNKRSSVFHVDKGKHSEKPKEVYEFIEETFPELTKLEMYARTPREGWLQWGDDPAILEKNRQERISDGGAEEGESA